MFRVILAVALGASVVGCGKTVTTAPPTEPPVLPVDPPAPAAAHEMDPAKHAAPATPASGNLGGKAFAPGRAVIEGKALTFRQGTGFFADLQIAVYFAEYNPSEAKKVVVNPGQKWHEATIPSLHVSTRKGEDLPNVVFVNDGYAMTLNLAPRANGKVAGNIYLCLPGAGKEFLAGTFTADYERQLNDPPEPEDRPYIAGKIAHTGKPKQSFQIRYAGMPAAGGDIITDMVGIQLSEKVGLFGVRSTSFAPRVIGLRPGKIGEEYDCSRLPPGKYFVVARLDEGPPAWKLVDVAANAAVDAPLTIPSGATGNLEVGVPVKTAGQVQAIPAGLKLDDPTGTFTTSISGALNAYGNVADGKASLKNLAPGRYDVSLRSGTAVYRAEATVEAGQTAKVELK